MADLSRNNLPSRAKPARRAAAPSITSSPRFPCPHCLRLFDSPQALGGHQNAHKHERAAQRTFPATHQQQYHAAVFFNVWPEHIQPPIISSPRFPCPHCCRLFDSPLALGGHQNAHKHGQAAQRNSPTTHQQQYHALALFPADQHQQHTSSIPFSHSPAVSTVTPDTLSSTMDVNDSSTYIDLALRLCLLLQLSNMADLSRNNLPSSANAARRAAGPSITSSPRFPCPNCPRMFDSPQALGGHQNAHKQERTAQRNFLATHQRQYQAAVFFNVWPEHIQPPIISSPLFRCLHSSRLFDTGQALAWHQNAHRHERTAQQNAPATHQQQYHPLALFPADQHQQHTSSIPFPHSPAVSTTTPDALSPNRDVDDSSADIDLALRL